MPGNEINIKSSTIEKGLELAKDFLGKLIMPTVDELGLLMSENIKYLRFKNQLNILLKAREHVQRKNISVKEIPVKILLPLLENASLEEEQVLQDKWSNMLVNMVDSEKNLQTQIFPYILSQISTEEYRELQKLNAEESHFSGDKAELKNANEKFDAERGNFESELMKELGERKRKLNLTVSVVEQSGFQLDLREFEKANLLRLGLIRQLPPSIYITQQEERRVGLMYDKINNNRNKIKAQYRPNHFGYRINELGQKFCEICEIEKEGEPS